MDVKPGEIWISDTKGRIEVIDVAGRFLTVESKETGELITMHQYQLELNYRKLR